MFSLISPAYGADDVISNFIATSGVTQFAPLILIFIVFYFLLLRPQQQAQSKLKESINAIKKGDRVLTAGGIIASVKNVREGSNEIEVEIAPNVKVTIIRETITNVLGS